MSRLLWGMCSTWLMARDSRGVARAKVVAVPASRAKRASRSMSLPGSRSVYLPRRGRQASEYFCLFLRRTWSINPKATARVM